MRKVQSCLAVCLALCLLLVGVPAAGASTPTHPAVAQSPAAHSSTAAIPIPAGSAVDIGALRTVDGHHLTAELVNPDTGARISLSSRHGVSPQISVGAGWYLYVYLNHGDFQWLLGMGYTAASAVICSILAPTIAGAIACAVVAYIIWSVITSQSPPWYGYCLQVKISWWGSLSGTSWVKRNC